MNNSRAMDIDDTEAEEEEIEEKKAEVAVYDATGDELVVLVCTVSHTVPQLYYSTRTRK